MSSADRLRAAMQKHTAQPLDTKPGTAWEMLADARLEDLEKAVANVQSDNTKFLWLIVGTIVLTLIKQIAGW